MLFHAKEIDPEAARTRPLSSMSPHSFRIQFSGGDPLIEANDPSGKRYAAEYLQDLRNHGALPQESIIVEDSPRFLERGFMLDISRDRVPTQDSLYRLVKNLSKLRYNQLQLYTEHTYSFKDHEQVWANASPMTESEIRELEDICADHHIELVPNQNCFGHMERWLRHSEYKHLAECPDGFQHPITGPREFGTTLFPSPESEVFVEEILSEVLPIFRSRKANIGGDEPWELGQGRSRDRAEREGKHEVYLSFLEKILSITERLGKEPIFWADIVLERPELVGRLPKQCVPAIWGYHPSHPYPEQCKIMAEAGFRGRFQVVPGTNTWNSFAGRLDHALENIDIASEQGSAWGARGLILTCWGDGGHHQSTSSAHPSLIHAARKSWNGSDDLRGDLPDRIDELFFPDQPSGSGEAVCALGQIDDQLPYPNPNSSFLHKAFFASRADLAGAVAPISKEQLKAVEAALLDIPCEGLSPDIELSRDMNLWAIRRCLATKGENIENGMELKSSLLHLRDRFATNWKRDSRIGGLTDSLGRFPVSEV